MCPIIDVISDDTFEYMAGSDMTYGGFNWKLNFRWYHRAAKGDGPPQGRPHAARQVLTKPSSLPCLEVQCVELNGI